MNIVTIKRYLLLLVLFGSISIHAQDIQFEEPVKFSELINTDAENINPLLSPDGKTLFFVRAFDEQNVGGKISGSDIWASKKNNGQWEKASNQNYPWNTKGSNAVIGVNQNNTIVYLLNSYSKKSGIAFSKFLNGKWTSPEVIFIPGMEKSEFVGYYMNATFDKLLISMNTAGSYGEEDLYISFKDTSGNWSTPVNLGSTINSDGFEIAPFLSSDERKIYFSSNGHKGLGDADVFVSERLYDSWNVWSKPRNLGAPINSEKFDSYFSAYGDSVYYLSSNRNSELSNIYQGKIRAQSALKDSVNKIVKETQQLLSGLKTDEESTNKKEKVEFIPFSTNSNTLEINLQDQINNLLRPLDLNSIRNIEITGYAGDTANPTVNYNLAVTRSQKVIEYLQTQNIDAKKLRARNSSAQNANGKNGVEIRIFLKN